MECVLQTVLGHALHELLVERHQSVGVAASNPVEFRVALSQLRELAVEIGVCRNRLHIDLCEVNASRVETDVVEHVRIVGCDHKRVHTTHRQTGDSTVLLVGYGDRKSTRLNSSHRL